jgi:hypothetical protein
MYQFGGFVELSRIRVLTLSIVAPTVVLLLFGLPNAQN